MNKKCLQCNKEFSKSIFCSKKEWETRKYCCKQCYTLSMKGKDLFNDKTRNNVAWNKDKKTGKSPKNTCIEKECLECGNKFTVKKYRKESANFCSVLCKTNNSNNGLSTENEKIRRSKKYLSWVELVFERDDWTCQKCLVRGGKLNAHHILNFSTNEDIRFNLDNGITFCRECHYKFHSEYGFNNNNQLQISEYLSVAQEA